MNKEIVDCIKDIPLILDGKKVVNCQKRTFDCDSLMKTAHDQGVFILAYKCYKDCFSDYDIHKFDNKINEYKNKKKVRLQYLKEIKYCFEKEGIDFFIIKGFVVSKIIYGNEFDRVFRDIDILVDYSQFKMADKCLRELGFVCQLDNDLPNLNSILGYEVKYEKNVDGYFVFCELKIATSSIKDRRIIEKFKKNSEIIEVAGENYITFDRLHTFLLLITNAYSDFEDEFTRPRFKNICDIVCFINNVNIDWIRLKMISKEYGFVHIVYAVLNLISSFYNGIIKEQIINLFDFNKDESLSKNEMIFPHGWLRDWQCSFENQMFNKDLRSREFYFSDSMKAYSSRNKNFLKMDKKDTLLTGIRILEYDFEFDYSFYFDDKLRVDIKFNQELLSDLRVVLLLYDLNREVPRKRIQIERVDDKYTAKCIENNIFVVVNEINLTYIQLEIDCRSIESLLYGDILPYRFYVLRKFNETDYALLDSRNSFDIDNPRIMFLG